MCDMSGGGVQRTLGSAAAGQAGGTGSTGADFDRQLQQLKAMQDRSIRQSFLVQMNEVEFSGRRRASQQQFA
jgi:hypothetical protein